MSESATIETTNALLVKNNALLQGDAAPLKGAPGVLGTSRRLPESKPDTMRTNREVPAFIAAKPGVTA